MLAKCLLTIAVLQMLMSSARQAPTKACPVESTFRSGKLTEVEGHS
jgi:hypothetical protein